MWVSGVGWNTIVFMMNVFKEDVISCMGVVSVGWGVAGVMNGVIGGRVIGGRCGRFNQAYGG